MSEHTLTISFDTYGNTTTRVNCHAPADAACHVTWDCGCESIYDYRLRSGVPIHAPEDMDGEEWNGVVAPHKGRFVPDLCNIKNWHENSEEDVVGEVTVPVTPQWEGDFYTFDITPPKTDQEESTDE